MAIKPAAVFANATAAKLIVAEKYTTPMPMTYGRVLVGEIILAAPATLLETSPQNRTIARSATMMHVVPKKSQSEEGRRTERVP